MRLPEDLLKRAKRKAASEGRTLTGLIEDGLRRVLNEHEVVRKAKRVLPPVSSARGGLRPGIDLNEMAVLQEMDDLEQVERLK